MRRRGFLTALLAPLFAPLLPSVEKLFGPVLPSVQTVTVDIANEIMLYTPTASPLLALTKRLKDEPTRAYVFDMNHVTAIRRLTPDPRLPSHYFS